jgi:hypothetical protein
MVWAAVIEAPEAYGKIVDPLAHNPVREDFAVVQ